MPYMEKTKEVLPIILTSENQKEKLKEITNRLEQGILEVFESERYKEYLRVMSKFHHYSFNNTMLIAMQKPDASLIAGFNTWKNSHGRTVKKGEKGIRIIAPVPFKVKQETEKIDPKTNMPVIGKDGNTLTEEKEITIPAYKVVSVFDVSQTEGRELPSIGVNELTGAVSQYEDFFTALKKASPVPIALEHIEGRSHGYYHLAEKRIAIDDGMGELQTLKTAIHEIAHAKLHDVDLNAPREEKRNRPDQRTREVEAESVAYTVCQHYGLDTSDYSFGYIAGWSGSKELSELKGSLETIRFAASELIDSIDEHFKELQKTKEKEFYIEADSISCKDAPEFLKPENYLKTAEQSSEQNFNMIDGIMNNTLAAPTVDELEQKVKAGESISLTELAKAVRAEEHSSNEPKKKQSIRTQLKEAQNQSAQKKHNTKTKSHELEV